MNQLTVTVIIWFIIISVLPINYEYTNLISDSRFFWVSVLAADLFSNWVEWIILLSGGATDYLHQAYKVLPT